MTKTAQAFDHSERKTYLGASEIAAVLGLNRYTTPLDVYNEKMGLVAPFEGNAHTRRGHRLEHIAAELFTEETGRKLRRMTRDLIHPEYDFIRGHVDRIVEGEGIVAEIKVVSVAMFRKLQREGLPENYIIQLQAYCGLGKYPKGIFIIFCPDQFEVISFESEFDETIYNAAMTAAAKFWNEHILTQTPPDIDTPASSIEFEKVGGDVTKRDDDAFREAAMLLREADQLLKDANELHELGKKRVLEAIENQPGKYEGGGLRLSYTMQAGRKTFDKKLLAAVHPEIDLSKFEKQGQPFPSFRAYFTNTQEN